MHEGHSVENMDRSERPENFSPLHCITPTAARCITSTLIKHHPRKIKTDTLRFLQTGTPEKF
jgi:hypothetical protein